MGLFSRDFSKAGPGVPKDEPRKKGISRFFEIIVREYRDLMKVNILFFLCVLPSVAMFFLWLFGVFGFALVLSIFLAYPIGGAIAASMFCVTAMLRDDPGFVWDDFKRKFWENLRQAGVAGVFLTTFLYTQVFLFWLPIMADWAVAGTAWVIGGLLLFFFVMMFAPYMFLHFAYIELGTFKIIKNSVLLALTKPGRSFMGAFLGLLPWVALFMFFPITLVFFPLIPFFMFVLSWLLTLMWVWPIFNQRFSVEETLNKERDEELG